MRLLYFGSDHPWPDLLKEGFRRRNTWLLKTFNESTYFSEVINVRKTTFGSFFVKLFRPCYGKHYHDLYYTSFFPVWLKGSFFRMADRLLNRLFFLIQGYRNLSRNENIIFCYWPKGYTQARELKLRGRYFLDTDHNIIDDENLHSHKKEEQEKLLLDAGKNCEYVISGARSMLKWYFEHGFENIYFMRNGIYPKPFEEAEPAILGFGKPVIGYIGTISKWIDYQALDYLIRKNPSWNFLVYGAAFKNKISEELATQPNCHFMGPLKPENVPETIKSFTAGLNLYRNESWLDVDSMKIYEYLAAGTPVVSLEYHPFLVEDFDGLLYLAKDAEEMDRILNDIVKGNIRPRDAGQFLEENSWKQRVDAFYEEIIRK
ncbi:MAG: glycosyltransferase [Bacteroidetes bacterium]|nr:glycosyltransferase [Bacteroidota bacterium]